MCLHFQKIAIEPYLHSQTPEKMREIAPKQEKCSTDAKKTSQSLASSAKGSTFALANGKSGACVPGEKVCAAPRWGIAASSLTGCDRNETRQRAAQSCPQASDVNSPAASAAGGKQIDSGRRSNKAGEPGAEGIAGWLPTTVGQPDGG